MLRGAAVAGADVGAVARRLSASALAAGSLRAAPVWLIALLLAAASAVRGGPIAPAATLLGIGVPVVLGIPALRAGLAASNDGERARILWFVQAALLSVVAFALGGVLSVVPGPAAGWLSFTVLAVAPMVVLLCVATALVPSGSIEPERALRTTAHFGGTAILTAAVFAVATAVLAPVLGGRLALATTAALLVAATCAVPAHTLLRAPAARLAPGRLTSVTADR